MVTVKSILTDHPELADRLLDGKFGIELEQHRIMTDGTLSRQPYPAAFGSRRHHPYLKTDFSDTMIELATPPTTGATAAVLNAKALQQIVHEQLQIDERFWPLSMLPNLSDADLEYASHNNTRTWMQEYHDHLLAKYGPEREIMTGVHIGYSLNSTLIHGLYHQGFKTKYPDKARFRNEMYFQLAQGFAIYRWLFTYLFGCTPFITNRPSDVPADVQSPVRSFRNSQYGYANLPTETITYADLDHYLASISDRVKDGSFYSHHEAYCAARLKCSDDTLAGLLSHGTEWIELRGFDLDPVSRAGISNDTLNFLELFMAYILTLDEPADLADQLAQADERNNQVALQHPHEQFDWVLEQGTTLLDQLEAFARAINAPKIYFDAILFSRRRLEDPTLTIAGQLLDQVSDEADYFHYGMKIANERFTAIRQATQPLQVFADRLTPDVQTLIKTAIELGVKIDLTDGIELSVGDHLEIFDEKITFVFPNGPQAYLTDLFPELAQLTDEQP